MLINQKSLRAVKPVDPMYSTKRKAKDSLTSFGLTESGYDLRILERLEWMPQENAIIVSWEEKNKRTRVRVEGNYVLASTMEELNMPDNLSGLLFPKSTWMRKKVMVTPAVVEPGYKGNMTLGIAFFGSCPQVVDSGSGICQLLFAQLSDPVVYMGKYQDSKGITEAKQNITEES